MELTPDIAADYLRVDAPTTSDLHEIENMLEGAISYIERSTGYIYKAQDRTYYQQPDGCFRIYDYPINTDLSALPGTPDFKTKSNYTLIDNPDQADSIDLNVGYTTRNSYPEALGQAVLQLVKHYYYESETKAVYADPPPAVRMTINKYRRFIL